MKREETGERRGGGGSLSLPFSFFPSRQLFACLTFAFSQSPLSESLLEQASVYIKKKFTPLLEATALALVLVVYATARAHSLIFLALNGRKVGQAIDR